MKPLTPDERLALADRTLEMVRRVEAFLEGKSTREELYVWAYSLSPHDGRLPFLGNPLAYDLYGCLWNLDSPIVRRCDLEGHLRALREGDLSEPKELTALTLSIEEVARRMRVGTLRFILDGLGWFEAARFASPATGRAFSAASSMERPLTVVRAQNPNQETLSDLFDTLAIDTAETIGYTGPPPPRWDLMRLDDNANSFLVASFTGYRKAKDELAKYEAKLHKQSYWLEAH
jgi:hypothetical protein